MAEVDHSHGESDDDQRESNDDQRGEWLDEGSDNDC